MRAIAVFCGSRQGSSPLYATYANKLGKELAERDITLVYGGASVGLMGEIANAALQEGGKVIGVIPNFLEEKEIAHEHVSELIFVNSMHERKAKMADLADGFIALPGGPGTLEEFFEAFTWAQLGLHQKPCGILNCDHYFDPLIDMFNQMTEKKFLQRAHRSIVIVEKEPISLLDEMMKYDPPIVKSYMTNKKQT